MICIAILMRFKCTNNAFIFFQNKTGSITVCGSLGNIPKISTEIIKNCSGIRVCHDLTILFKNKLKEDLQCAQYLRTNVIECERNKIAFFQLCQKKKSLFVCFDIYFHCFGQCF